MVYETLPIERTNDAHAILKQRENIGKVVLTVPPQEAISTDEQDQFSYSNSSI
jgi:hypothetical protein